MIALGLLLIADKFAWPVLLKMLNSMAIADVTLWCIAGGYNLLLILVDLIYLRRNWQALQANLPAGGSTDASNQATANADRV